MHTATYGKFSFVSNHFRLPVGVYEKYNATDFSRMDFIKTRGNKANTNITFPEDGECTWGKGELRDDGYVYGEKRSDGRYDYEVRYIPDSEDLEYMAIQDWHYLTDLFDTNRLEEVEPDVAALWKGDIALGKVQQGTNIGDWWVQNYCNKPDVDQKLADAQNYYKQSLTQQSSIETGKTLKPS